MHHFTQRAAVDRFHFDAFGFHHFLRDSDLLNLGTTLFQEVTGLFNILARLGSTAEQARGLARSLSLRAVHLMLLAWN